jgi:hypothetical protein
MRNYCLTPVCRISTVAIKFWLVFCFTFFSGSVCHSGVLTGYGTWETTLQPRDLDRNGITDAYYDTDLKITWLATTFMGDIFTLKYNIEALEFGGLSNWRLPQRNTTCDYYSGSCLEDEMGHLSFVEFGRRWFTWSGTGRFPDLINGYYAEEYMGRDESCCSAFQFGRGSLSVSGGFGMYGLAVHDGDVTANHIPEPRTIFLLASGIFALLFFCRRPRIGMF